MTSRLPRWTKTPARALADALVRRYPDAWRGRYEAEVLALLEDSDVRWRDVGDLLTGLLMERARALIEPGDHPLRTSVALAAIHFSTPVALFLLAGALAVSSVRCPQAFAPLPNLSLGRPY